MPVNYIDGATIKGTSYDLHDPRTDHKAEIDGSYADLTAGNAEQLVSTVGVTDKVPYVFRTSGGNADIGDREEDSIIGGSVVWNQLVKNGNFAEGTTGWSTNNAVEISASNNTLTATATGANPVLQSSVSAYMNIPKDHVLFFSGVITPNQQNASTLRVRLMKNDDEYTSFYYGVPSGTTPVKINTVRKTNYDLSSSRLRIFFDYTSATVGNTYTVNNIQLIDLTQMFGAAIADYIYSLEQANAGAGVAWFRKLFPKEYYAYNAGTLMSVQTSAHNMVGFNAYNSATGKAQLVGGMEYQITGAYTALTFEGETITPDVNGKFTPATNGELTVAGGNSTTTCVHLVLDGERDGEYEPYQLNSYPLDDSLVLRGVPRLDSDNKLYFEGDTYEADGTVTRKFREINLGLATWTSRGTGTTKRAYSTDFSTANRAKYSSPIAIAEKYLYNGVLSTFPTDSNVDNRDYGIYLYGTSSSQAMTHIVVVIPASETSSDISGKFSYQLLTPTTETADPYQTPQVVDNWGTEEYVDAGTRDVEIPVGHETKYLNDLRAKLESAPDSPDGDGDYIVRQSNGENTYVPLVIPAELPSNPSEDGTYVLKATVSDGTTVLSWEVQE